MEEGGIETRREELETRRYELVGNQNNTEAGQSYIIDKNTNSVNLNQNFKQNNALTKAATNIQY